MCTKKNGILTEYFGMEELKTFLTNFSEVNTVPKPIYFTIYIYLQEEIKYWIAQTHDLWYDGEGTIYCIH